ncbi:hypothetical protein [Legionella israelensis]|uniref:Protein IcmD (DotP) n=1 Tax=Legionella israelensis TaxID=454 RepID=A0A0W0WS66_9GAMM|nr:hypothetical protein [Legionella israelensis]KTD35160.1 protein IcmD (DotP) [Legionella israelensis]QBS08688.1 type IV secretion protein IcmD [Legionella israelensis]SCY00764.1 hypothetical protein SAMN02746069_00966 [Legionella israelensis DSM 19235]STX58355.1 protein IcmD (DotP) [Legionella israelensis]
MYLIVLFLLMYCGLVYGATDLGDMASFIRGSFVALARLLTAVSYIAGLAFIIAAIAKFKQHKDNPTQIPIGTPLALSVIALALVFFPTILGIVGETVFGEHASTAGPKGVVYCSQRAAVTENSCF